MRVTLGLLLLTATICVGVFPSEAGAKDRKAPQAKLTGEVPPGVSKSRNHAHGAKLDSCRQKLAANLDVKLGGILEARNELRQEFAERRQSYQDSSKDLQKIETELRNKLGKLRRGKNGDDAKARAEVEQLVRKSRTLKKSLARTKEVAPMAEQLRAMEAKIQATASEVLNANPGCQEFKEALIREASAQSELQRLDKRGSENSQSTLK